MRLKGLLILGLIVGASVPAAAQRQRAAKDSVRSAEKPIPASARPPKGMCRIWIDNVPAAQQPAATDCPTAVKNRPANGHVIFGDEYSDTTGRANGKQPPLPPGVKSFTDLRPAKTVLPARPPEG
ncbi:MAG TPA: hypothetical protein VHV78_07995 [Gemmatimonadaceae bacterium]|nr:hypothetical protein [Gemmatimonadaceae bacterium]